MSSTETNYMKPDDIKSDYTAPSKGEKRPVDSDNRIVWAEDAFGEPVKSATESVVNTATEFFDTVSKLSKDLDTSEVGLDLAKLAEDVQSLNSGVIHHRRSAAGSLLEAVKSLGDKQLSLNEDEDKTLRSTQSRLEKELTSLAHTLRLWPLHPDMGGPPPTDPSRLRKMTPAARIWSTLQEVSTALKTAPYFPDIDRERLDQVSDFDAGHDDPSKKYKWDTAWRSSPEMHSALWRAMNPDSRVGDREKQEKERQTAIQSVLSIQGKVKMLTENLDYADDATLLQTMRDDLVSLKTRFAYHEELSKRIESALVPATIAISNISASSSSARATRGTGRYNLRF